MLNIYRTIHASLTHFILAFLHFIYVLIPWIPGFRRLVEGLVASLKLLEAVLTTASTIHSITITGNI